MRYFAAVSFILPPSTGACEAGHFGVEPRAWDVSVFDWAQVATDGRHRLRFPYTLADVLSANVNLELWVDSPDFATARRELELLYFAMLCHGVLPFSMPYIATHSLNRLSGLNGTHSKAPPGLSEPLRNGSESYEAQLFRPSLRVYSTGAGATPAIEGEVFGAAVEFATTWRLIEESQPGALVLRTAIATAPAVTPPNMGVLLMWTAIESLFPSVSTELKYRLSLSLAQLCSREKATATEVAHVRNLYDARSKIAHGGSPKGDPWPAAWKLSIGIARSIARRGSVPTEDALLAELLG